jgi:hypothetical protein
MTASFDPFTYTAGRWLHRDKAQLQARFLEFDFHLLCKKAVDACPGAKSVLECMKKEGGFNRVFILSMDNGARIVAKLPFRVAGPPNLMTNSEVATMAYGKTMILLWSSTNAMTVRSHTSIPVPKVLDWAADAQNPVGAEYIIMEHVSGVQLHEAWPTMDSHQHMLVTKNLAYAVAEMANLTFPVYGSLYFATHANTLQKKVDVGVADGFVVGPNCGREYWEYGGDDAPSGRNECSTNRGPCQYILYHPIL